MIKKYISKKVLALLVLCTFNVTYAMDNDPVEPQKPAIHLPLTILINNATSHVVNKRIDTLTETFAYALRAKRSAILVSKSIFLDFLFRNQKYNTFLEKGYGYFTDDFALETASWDLYACQNMQFFTGSKQLLLCIPKDRIDDFFQHGFKKNQCENFNIVPLLEKKVPLKRAIDNHFLQLASKSKATVLDDFKRLFNENSHSIISWDIFWAGHGTYGLEGKIGGLSVLEAESLLAFCNNTINVNMLVLDSCYSGSVHLETLKLKYRPTETAALKFILMTLSSSDLPTSLYFENKENLFFKKLFDEMEQLGVSPGYTLEHLVKNISMFLGPEHVDYRNIPQIILPGGTEVVSFAPDNTVKIIDESSYQSAVAKKEPLKIYPYQDAHNFDYPLNVLVYPVALKVPVYVRDAVLNGDVDDPGFFPDVWLYLPSYVDLLANTLNIVEDDAVGELLVHERAKKRYLCPHFISMYHQQPLQYIDTLIFEGKGSDGKGGILKGIRDSFTNIKQRPTQKVWYIDRIKGSNDIAPMLKLIQKVYGLQEHPIIKFLQADWQDMQLERVFISTEYIKQAGLSLEIVFILNKHNNETCWKFVFNEAKVKGLKHPAWFLLKQEEDIDEYKKAYDGTRANIFSFAEKTMVAQPSSTDSPVSLQNTSSSEANSPKQ